ncbi:hypothetical protein H740_07666, partial [Campylobacter showae CC57C]
FVALATASRRKFRRGSVTYFIYAPSLGLFPPRLLVAKSRYERLREVKKKNTSPECFAFKFKIKFN